MTILFRYFLRVYLGNFVRVMLGLSVVTILIDMVELSRRLSSLVDFTIFDMAILAGLRAPSFLQTIVPFVVLFASMMTLLSLNKRHELVITRASGMSAWQFIAPLCLGNLMLGVIVIALFNPLAAASLAKAGEFQIKEGISAPSGGNTVPWFRQTTEDGAVIIGAEQASAGGSLLGRPSLYFFDPNDNPVMRVDAQTGQLIEGNWVLTSATIYRDGKIESTASFSTPALIDRQLLGQALTPPDTISFFDLLKSIEVARAFGLPAAPYSMRWHSLVAIPALLVAMTLIAATVSLRFARFGHSSAAVLGGIVAGFLLYVVSEMAEALGGSGIVAPVISAWLPVISASFFGVTFLLHKEDG